MKSVIGIPIEAERVALDSEVMNAWYADMGLKIQVVPPELILKVDETGCSERGDRQEVKVIVPVEHPDPSLNLLFDRHAKLSALTACIAGDGIGLRPFMIVHRLTAELELK
jgi:hypothetical protein